MADLIQIGVDVRTNIKQATADLDKMGGSVVNNIRTIDRLESEVKQLNNALSKGSATEAAYAKGMRQINNELSLFQQRAAKAAQVEKKFGTAAATGGNLLWHDLFRAIGEAADSAGGGIRTHPCRQLPYPCARRTGGG